MKAFVLLLMIAAMAQGRDVVSANDQARFLAGLPVASNSPLAALTQSAAWSQHAAEMDAAWARCERQSLSKTRAWAGKFIQNRGSSASCYYMFSGPDILYAHTIFPGASNYILCGIEPVGRVPDIAQWSPEQLAAALAGLRRSLSNVLRFSYFITKDMKADLSNAQLTGTVPIMFFFLARMGCEVVGCDYINRGVPGVRITFRSGSGSQTAYYFAGDLSNGASGRTVMNFCRSLGANGVGLLKAASYLLHEGSFSSCREFLLSSCQTIVQDDSGIPHRFYDPQRWQLRYFGTYVGTTGGPFEKYYQADLAAAYSTVNPVEIDFQLSYQWDPRRANVLVASRVRGAPPAAAQSSGEKPSSRPGRSSSSPATRTPKKAPTPKAAPARTLRLKTS